MPALNITGQKFGRLTAVRDVGADKRSRSRLWEFSCECGETIVRVIKAVRSGDTSSCGCLRRDKARWAMTGPNHPKYCGGEFNRGSEAWCRRLLTCSRRAADRGGYEPLSLSVSELMSVISGESGACEICERPFKDDYSRCLDHDHKTGEFRGIICRQCNSTLGLFSDDPNHAAARFLSYTRGRSYLGALLSNKG